MNVTCSVTPVSKCYSLQIITVSNWNTDRGGNRDDFIIRIYAVSKITTIIFYIKTHILIYYIIRYIDILLVLSSTFIFQRESS
ncbi:MAG: hypothetical protein K2L98_02300 [Bacilli bacterium]|nr:hypothetical protein [Bacilli bacterium]